MLKIYLDGILLEELETMDDNDIITDVELAFNAVKLCGSEVEAIILREIEQAQYKDATHIIDRFGDKLSIDFISTGCKAALVVLNNPDKVVSLVECGYNARDIIINYCKDGAVIMPESAITIVKEVETIDIEMEGYKFTDIDEVNHYIQDYYSICATGYEPYTASNTTTEGGKANV